MGSYSLGPPPPPPARPPQAGKNPRRKLYIGVAIAVGVFALIAMITGVVTGGKMVIQQFREPSQALTVYTDALIQKNYGHAYSLAAPGFRASTSYDALLAYHAKLTSQYGALKSAKQTYWHIETENGITSSTIQAALQFERGGEIFEFVLRKEGGVWRVYNYKPVTSASS